MAEMMAPRRKSKVKKAKFCEDAVPSLPDLNLIEVDRVETVDTDGHAECVGEGSGVMSQELVADNDERRSQLVDNDERRSIMVDNDERRSELTSDAPAASEEIAEGPVMANIERLYPSITQLSISSVEVPVADVDSKNSLDVVTERITKPLAPVEEWRLPSPMPLEQLARYYENELLDGLEAEKAQFSRNMRGGGGEPVHPLAELVAAYERSAKQLANTEAKLRAQRDDSRTAEAHLWLVIDKTEWREARCRDNALQRQTISYEEATFSGTAARLLEAQLARFCEEALDEHALRKYEAGLCRALVEDFLGAVRAQASDVALRQCLVVLFRCLRALPVLPDCTAALRQWIGYLASGIAASGTPPQRLYLLWELLHAPAGVAEWAAGLVQTGTDARLCLAALAMLLGPRQDREAMLGVWQPGTTGQDESGWALVDSDGEDDASIGTSWALMRESDLVAFLNQIPVVLVFQHALDGHGGDDGTSVDDYDAARGCHPGKLLRVMALCDRVVAILGLGLDNHANARYKALNKRISRLIKHTIQFLTDHLEAVLCTSVLPQFDYLFPRDSRLQMLAQYEAIYERSLVVIVDHRLHGNWQCLTDLPWRMLSPQRKWAFLADLIDQSRERQQPSAVMDSDTGPIGHDMDWWLTNLQNAIDLVSQDDGIYLLTAISNLGLEARPIIDAEMRLLATITGLIFQLCYVIPSTRSSFSKVGRELLSSLCLQHPQALSIVLDAIKLWHPTVGQMGLFLFRELPFCLMAPSDTEFRLLASWLLDHGPGTVCNQLGRHVFSNLNWGFANTDETVLYLPLSLHQRMAALLVSSFKKHSMDARPGPWFVNESIKLVTYLWWNQESIQDQSFHAWCLSLAIRLRLHPSTRSKVTDALCLQPSAVMHTSDWTQALADAHQDRCSHPVAMYMAVTTWPELASHQQPAVDGGMLKLIHNLIVRHQQYRLGLELLHQLVVSASSVRRSLLLANDVFATVWKLVIHADDTYYNMVKNLITKQFPGPVLACIGNSFCPSMVIANGDKDHQEAALKFFIQTLVSQPNWISDNSFLWLLDRLLEIGSALDLRSGTEEIFVVVKQLTDKQFVDASKRSGLAQILRLGGSYTPLLNQLATGGDFTWLRAAILEAEARVEDEMGLWREMLHRLLVRKKREPRTVNAAMSSACKHLHLGLTCSASSLVIIQAAQLLAACPAEHWAIIRVAAVFFQRYLGFAQVWSKDLVGLGSPGHRIFQDDAYHPLLQQARTAIAAAQRHREAQLDAARQLSPPPVATLDSLTAVVGRLEMLLLWIDEPRLHLEDMAVSALPSQYRADLLNMARAANLSVDSLAFPRRVLLDQTRQAAALWDTRHDLDFRFMKLAHSALCKPVVPIATRLLQRFKRQLNVATVSPPPPPPATANYNGVAIPAQAITNSTQVLEFVSGPLSAMYQCAAKQKANKNFLADLDKKYIVALGKQYEPRAVNQTVQLPCNRGPQACAGYAVLNLNHQTWVKRTDVVGETSRNRQDYHQLVDEMVKFASLEKLVKGVVTMQHLVMKIDAQLQLCRNEEDFRKVVDCGLALFFHLGRQINPETQKYPPHHMFVSSTMDTIGSKFMKFASNQATVLLSAMLDNDLLVEVYSPHFCPNSDTAHTAQMYTEVTDASQTGKCSHTAACTILSKFNIRQFLDCSPSLASKANMVDAIIKAIGHAKLDAAAPSEMGGVIEETHVANLVTLLSASFGSCLGRVMDGFRSLCESGKLGTRFWAVVTRCIEENINENNELSLSIDEVRLELDSVGSWLNKRRFSDAVCNSQGLYVKFGGHAGAIVGICGRLLESLVFKLARSANENIAPWHEVVDKIWDLFLKIYIPWIQSFASGDTNNTKADIRLPWRVEDQESAEKIVGLAMEQLNVILRYISNAEAQSFLLHCVLLWIANGLVLLKELPVRPYHELYCRDIKTLQWHQLKPSVDCMQVISELVSRPWMSDQCKVLMIEIASQWTFSNSPDTTDFVTHLFDMFVNMICKTKFVFKIEAVERLTDTLIELNWNRLPGPVYRRGMDQLVTNLEPRIILCNPTTIEGKIIKFLNHAAGCIPSNDDERASYIELAIEKQTIYVRTVVKLLSIAFSFTQAKNSKTKSSGDNNQVKLFQLRISGLFTEIEYVILQVSNRDVSQKMAISLLTEVCQLFKNPSIAELALDPVIGWLQESRSSPLILPFLIVTYRCGLHISSMVRLTQQLIESYILSDQSDGGPATWATINGCARLDPELQHTFWKESVKQSCMLCLAQQLIVSLPSICQSTHTEQWQARIVEWLEQTRPQGVVAEHSTVIIIYVCLQLLLLATKTSSRPGSAFKNFIQLLLKLSESKTSSGFLGKVGLGKKSNFSFEFRMLCRSLSVFLHCQYPTSNVLRIHPNDPGAVTSPDMAISSRTVGEALPTNKTMQNLEWLKSQRLSKELSANTKAILEGNISYICDPKHTMSDCTDFVRQMTRQLWPDNRLLNLIHH